MASIQARIATIQQRFAPVQPPVSSASAASSTATSLNQSGDFASLLAQATTATPSGADADLSKYSNGKIPESLLASIGGNEKLAAPAARKFNEMKASAAAAGVKFSVNDSYRSYDDQVDMAKRKGLYSQGGLAAKPGTSEHGLGLSVDLQLDSRGLQWMKANAGKFGFVNNVKGESWHWTYKP